MIIAVKKVVGCKRNLPILFPRIELTVSVKTITDRVDRLFIVVTGAWHVL